MKRTLLSGLLALPLYMAAQTLYFSDDFESYTPDTFLCVQTTDWITWSNDPGSTEDVLVSTANAAMGVQSIHLSSPGGNGPEDILLPLDNQTSGQWTISFYIYVDANNGGYFNLQKTDATPFEWAVEVYFNADGSGEWEADGTAIPFTYTNDSWVHVEVWIDLDTDEARAFIGGSFVHEWPWSTQANGDPGGQNQFGGLNLYAATNSGPASFYIDEVEVYGPDAFATSIEENETLSFDFFPNPATDVLNIQVQDPQDLYFNVFDLTGKVVMQNVGLNMNSSTTTMDVSELPSGIYLLEMSNKKQRFAKRFVKE